MSTAFADDLREMMAAWATIEKAARAQHPSATDQEVYKITASAMNHSLGLK